MLTDSDKQVTGNRGRAPNKDEMDKEDPTQGMPVWLQPFTDDLEDLQTNVPVQSSDRGNSDSEAPANVVTLRKHSIYIHFPKTEIATYASGPKSPGFLAEGAVRDQFRVH